MDDGAANVAVCVILVKRRRGGEQCACACEFRLGWCSCASNPTDSGGMLSPPRKRKQVRGGTEVHSTNGEKKKREQRRRKLEERKEREEEEGLGQACDGGREDARGEDARARGGFVDR